MLRAFLLVYPFLAVYVTVCTVLFVPLAWITRDVRLLYWLAQTGVRGALWLSGVRVKTVHEERGRRHPTCVFVSNHVSNIDPPALFMTLPRIAVVLKKELGRIPLLGYVMKMGGFIYVDRRDRNSRRLALEASVAALRGGLSLLIFPEGTRSPDGSLLPFRPGPVTMALEAQVPMVPITVWGSRELMPKGRASIRPGTVTLFFHEPVETAGLGQEDRAALMVRVREIIGHPLAGDGSPASSPSVAPAV
jgi:1-acyl-sn-glycerol-3-phosphate acyltransferase